MGHKLEILEKNASATLSLMLLACCKFGEEGKVLKEATATRLSYLIRKRRSCA